MKQTEIDYWIDTMLDSQAGVSDLNFTVDKPLQVESAGQLEPVTITPNITALTPFQTEVLALNLIGGNKRLLRELVSNGSCDLSYRLGVKARFRVNIFSQRGHYSAVLRRLPTEIPTIESMHLPAAMNEMTDVLNGFILVTGSTGSGKSTTLAALLDKINREKAVHTITLEDPIEFVHPHRKATFNQRELGNDFDSFANGLRAALRQAPKVILVGEMRDRETIDIGLTAAETGHLVLSTLHTIDAGSTINRCLGMFEHDEQPQIRNRLADTLRWIIGQRLLPKINGGRVAAFEILKMSLRVRDLILHGEGEERTFYEIISAGTAQGMTTFDQYILSLFEKGMVTEEIALQYCSQRNVMGRGLDQLKAAKGEKTTSITGLAMEEEDSSTHGRNNGFSR
ncbi:MAG: PilT/PilU family type 4a pilus ATPase [Desulfurivibrionaceae bacterium]|nr:PilT/PilU family type 4a pilus ATPase [Desulfurivibrionaceae bacterium]